MSAQPEDVQIDSGADLGAEFGRISIRVFVLEPLDKKKAGKRKQPEEEVPADQDDDFDQDVVRPIDSYLESGKRGRLSCVFLVNGQRQHGLDNAFIARDLELRYIKSRTLIMVEVDELTNRAISDLMTGARQQFFQGEVFDAIFRRVIATLKNDKDLERLEEQAEEQVSSLKAGDEAVKSALDQLIDSHHEAGSRLNPGADASGVLGDAEMAGTAVKPGSVVSEASTTVGKYASDPVLLMDPDLRSIRLTTNVTSQLVFRTRPGESWKSVRAFNVRTTEDIPELNIATQSLEDHGTVDLTFKCVDDADEDNFPIRTRLQVIARLEGFEQDRLYECAVTISKPRQKRKKPPKPVLLDVPTELRVISRLPVSLVIGGADAHVKLQWNGKDESVVSRGGKWTFGLTRSPGDLALPCVFTEPRWGKFEVLIAVPADLAKDQRDEYIVTASGPDGKTLVASFSTIGVDAKPDEDLGPRTLPSQVPTGAERRAPYDLLYIEEKDWDTDTCWGGSKWGINDPGAFQPPTKNKPLILCINVDYGPLKEFKQGQIDRGLQEGTIQKRVTDYQKYIAYHLWQMHGASVPRPKSTAEDAADDPARGESDDEQRAEIQRVAVTLLRIMDKQ